MNRMLKPTIISIAMATVMAGAAISPALGLIAANFPDADPVLIKLILTAPSLIIIPFTFVSSYLTTKIPKRSIVMIGLAIYVIAGVGLVMPLAITLISDNFHGREQVKMMGFNSAFSNLGGSEMASTVISFTTVGGMIISLTLIRLQDTLKSFIMPVSLLVMGIAFVGLSMSHSIPVILACTCMIGLDQGIVFPVINVKALSLVNPLQSDRVIAAISSLIYVGQFSSPLVLDFIARLAGYPTIRFQYSFIGIALLTAVCLMLLYWFFGKVRTSSNEV
ncbi:MFS transporter [Sporosarcina obsidiansis]|uniref:MFS transporter n=1 Tax=Sporosarcina obsidiansis TaxID=2660748 RepID=UPI001E3D7290|nr:MFS transporter [Sporosarcina obsidiansis]